MVILLMRLEMLSQVFDTLAEEGNLHFRRTGVRVVQTILGNYVFFDVRVLWHFLILPRIASRFRRDTIRADLSRSTPAGELLPIAGQLAARLGSLEKFEAIGAGDRQFRPRGLLRARV